jgi:hypothetical protein
MSEQPKCERCDSTGWVCENHDHRPWAQGSERADACDCGAGAPCAICNEEPGVFPRLLPGSTVICSAATGWRQ